MPLGTNLHVDDRFPAGIDKADRLKEAEGFFMASSRRSAGTEAQAVVSMQTSQLKEKLNQVFNGIHARQTGSRAIARDAAFDKLWDLKESAILEGRKTVELPKQWVAELDQAVSQCANSTKH
jgi:DNA phosphorothioation-dependent restriction protein DptG